MVRTQIQLTEAQHQALRELAQREQVSMSELVRRALDDMLERGGPPDDQRSRARALAVIGRFEGGGGDVADKHDDYLANAFDG